MTNKKRITPKQFNKLTSREQDYYIPLYGKYKKVRRSDYCENCGKLEGYYYEERGIGKPIKYQYSLIQGVMMPKIVETILGDNVLMKNNLIKWK